MFTMTRETPGQDKHPCQLLNAIMMKGLPADPPRTPAPAPRAHRDTNKSSEKRELRILMIEDSELLRDRLIVMLDEPGRMRVVATAATEAEAIAQIDAGEHDVLLVDVELRVGNGIGAIRHVRRSRDADRQPMIIVLTNYPLPVIRKRCIEAGADYFLDKLHQFQDVKPLIAGARSLPPGH